MVPKIVTITIAVVEALLQQKQSRGGQDQPVKKLIGDELRGDLINVAVRTIYELVFRETENAAHQDLHSEVEML